MVFPERTTPSDTVPALDSGGFRLSKPSLTGASCDAIFKDGFDKRNPPLRSMSRPRLQGRLHRHHRSPLRWQPITRWLIAGFNSSN